MLNYLSLEVRKSIKQGSIQFNKIKFISPNFRFNFGTINIIFQNYQLIVIKTD